jgi:MerR family mercuric resistance operon transcriptional regulator
MTTRPGGRGIGALSKRTGCNVETIRYYERIGLMHPASRSEGGHRLYAEPAVRRLGFIRRTRQLGFTLEEVRTLLKLVDGGRYTCAQVKGITIHHLDDVRRKLSDLQKIERVLREMAAQCEGGKVPKCPVIDALFEDPPGVVEPTSPRDASFGRPTVRNGSARHPRRNTPA